MNFIGQDQEGRHSHWLVYAMCLSIDPLSCIGFFTECLPYLQPMTPICRFFYQNFPAKSKSCWNYLDLVQFHTQWTPFSDLSPNESNNPLFARKLSLMVPWFDASVGAPPSLLYVILPQEGGTVFPNNMEVSGLICYNKGAWPQIIRRYPSDIIYLQVPSGKEQ